MSIVTIQIGQCGNQLGHTFYQTVISETKDRKENDRLDEEIFFRRSDDNNGSSKSELVARSVMVDMEPKVINQCQTMAKKSGIWKYDSAGYFYKQSGSANNWAYGYNVHGPSVFEDVTEKIRKEVEQCDYLGGIVALQSLAGGTGSGLGSFITESLSDLYPSTILLNTVVWPHESGEVIVQNFNTLLSMSCLTSVSDGVIVFENDLVNQICNKLLNMKNPSFMDMNEVIAKHLASVMLSGFSRQDGGGSELIERNMLSRLTRHLCAHSMPKTSKEFSTHQWPGMMKHLYQMHVANSGLEEGINWNISFSNSSTKSLANHAVASTLFIRGAVRDPIDVTDFRNPSMYAKWNFSSFDLVYHPHNFNNYDKCASMISNCQSIIRPLNDMLEHAHNMYVSKAYLHQYDKYGVEKEFFEDSFVRMEQILQNYRSLSPNSV